MVAGRLVFELFEKVCPKTSANFRALCNGSKGFSKLDKKKPLHYRDCPLHRLVPDYVIQGGDILRGDGSSGDSIYSGKFNDEKPGLKLKFNEFGRSGRGVLAMANSGSNSNTSQFFITLTDDSSRLAKLNGKYVVFGQLVEGWEVLDRLNQVSVNGETPTIPVFIHDCGEI